MTIKCKKCNHEAIIFQKYSGMHLCRKHFIEDVERKIKLTVRKNYSINKNDVIAVALSGGKDSAVALYIMHKILGDRPDIELVAISVDEGIEGYRPKSLETAKELTRKLGVRHIIKSFSAEHGTTMDEIAAMDREKGTCSYCGVLRKNILNRVAMEIGATKLVTGHNLDDEAQTILLNHFRGDMERMVRLSPPAAVEGLVLRAKPLRNIPEKEVALYALMNGLPVDFSECPYAGEAMRKEIRELLNDFETKHPGTKYSLLRGFDKLVGALAKELPPAKIEKCRICGETCTEDICQACKLLGRA
ncbi:TIGR00269 family protein [Methanosarcina sp. KYL-1]|uniref:TIGR00269 family protein n=1 Tax=Methanosarcina sp. KYL-1 TaxID=2602068 RepID=UPI0021010BC5|nr:TIGR00269 family protein [Methanosarcina sp. KYL-1]MCQ1535676.1 TIGR00269 family protein [Methanosarcina sp. KYL-1]